MSLYDAAKEIAMLHLKVGNLEYQLEMKDRERKIEQQRAQVAELAIIEQAREIMKLRGEAAKRCQSCAECEDLIASLKKDLENEQLERRKWQRQAMRPPDSVQVTLKRGHITKVVHL